MLFMYFGFCLYAGVGFWVWRMVNLVRKWLCSSRYFGFCLVFCDKIGV